MRKRRDRRPKAGQPQREENEVSRVHGVKGETGSAVDLFNSPQISRMGRKPQPQGNVPIAASSENGASAPANSSNHAGLPKAVIANAPRVRRRTTEDDVVNQLNIHRLGGVA